MKYIWSIVYLDYLSFKLFVKYVPSKCLLFLILFIIT